MTRGVFWCLLFVGFVLNASVPAQSKQVTEAELDKLKSVAVEKRKGLPVRIRTMTSGYAKDASTETLSEFGPNDTYHYISIRRAKGVETRAEGIRIGSVRYTRQQNGNWVREEPTGKYGGIGSGSGSGVATGAVPETTIEYSYLGTTKINNAKTEHYRKIKTIKFPSNPKIGTRRVVEEYWFRPDGLIVKELREDTFERSKQTHRSVTEYEYPEEITIVAPIPK